MIKKILLYFLVGCITASCAIHKDFPYICFLPGCIAKQFGLPSFREVKARNKSRKKARQAKRARGKSKKDNGNGKIRRKPGYYEEEEPVVTKKDSFKYSFSPSEEDKFIVVRFTKKNYHGADSILVKYPENGSDISSYDKQLLKVYVDSHKVGTIEMIRIEEHTGKKREDDYYEGHNTPVKRKLSEFFIELGIPPEKIRMKK